MKVYITYHPDLVLKGGYEFEKRISEDFARFRNRPVRYPTSKLFNARAKTLGFDTEFASDGKLLTVGLATSSESIALETTEKDWLKKTRKLIRNAKRLAGHSIAGDIDYLVRLGLAKESWLKGEDIADSFLLARMVDENRGKGGYGLEQLFLSTFNFESWKGPTTALLKKTGNAADWPVELRKERCRLDAWATCVLAEYYKLSSLSKL